jgi:hypothetical protein
MRFKWMPWKWIVRYMARRHGFLDPINLMSQLQRFIQPSEVNEPVELLRAGALMHARGLINNRVIQHNLDWVWPYWIERQFDPRDISFIPRAFSITHINLSHRNWTAVGLPDYPDLPIVDPRGLLTPFIDGWSLDSWLVTQSGRTLLPSRMKNVEQILFYDDELRVLTKTHEGKLSLQSQASVILEGGKVVCRLDIEAVADEPAWIVLALRPYNPEGVSFVDEVSLNTRRNQWLIDDTYRLEFSRPADRHHISNYQQGDVYIHLNDMIDEQQGECHIGMVTAAAMFKLEKNSHTGKVSVRIPLQQGGSKHEVQGLSWQQHLQGVSVLQVPLPSFQSLYDIALKTLLLHSCEDIYPGPYTYKRFWFRDAVFIIHALLCAGLNKRAEQAIDRFSSRQDLSGYFHSQEGEWDSNGQVLWVLQRFCQLNNQAPKPQWLTMIKRGAQWIINKRLPHKGEGVHDGLLPAGFSAEHLGPNNYYYWDNFWGIAGLKAAGELFALVGDTALSQKYQQAAREFQDCVDKNLNVAARKLGRQAMPAAPTRRLDAGAIGSLALAYPAQLCDENDQRALDTCEFLLEYCCVDQGFFQDMTHSGINAYLTLHIAQVLMRAGDVRYEPLMQRVADLATSTGQWPEAIHPRTEGGCMGDGQHVWAAAEWILMVRNCFVREEDDCLVIGAGVSKQWLASQQIISFGPAATSFGDVTINIEPQPFAAQGNTFQYSIRWQGRWHTQAPRIEVRLPGQEVLHPLSGENSVTCKCQL